MTNSSASTDVATDGAAMSDVPLLGDIEAAARRIAGHAVLTPLIEHPALNERVGGRVLLKAENFQRTGSFKFRGAYNSISQIDPATCPGGVVAASSGNHAQGVAAAARMCGLSAAIVMPADAPAIKIARTKAFGAEVITYDRASEDRNVIAEQIRQARDAVFVPPFDDFDIICGQGTAGLEIADQADAIGVEPDQVLVCCAGGGLTAGVATALTARFPGCAVHTVEPAGFDDFARSLAADEICVNARKSGSVCDALLVDRPGTLNFAIGRELFGNGLVISDEEALAAVRFAFEELKLVLEPGGAVALAAVLAGKIGSKGRATICVLSGGNVDAATFARAIGAAA